jgi:hypothetical protein
MNLDIVDLISSSDVSKLYSDNYKNRLIEKVTTHFNGEEQKLFIASFYCYLNHNPKTEFIINLANIWKWLGFSRIDHCKRVLEKHFEKNKDFVINFAPQVGGAKTDENKDPLVEEEKNDERIFPNLGENKINENFAPQVGEAKTFPKDELKNIEERRGRKTEIILMTVNTFKKLCLKSSTKRADEIHEYFIKLEEILNESMKEQAEELTEELTKELNRKLEEQQEKLLEHKEQSELEKQELLEKTILEQFQRNTQCVYYGTIDDISLKDEELIKYGNSNDLPARIKCHKKTYTNFKLVKAYKVNNQLHIENCIKQHDKLKNRRRNITINDKLYTECLALNDKFTIDKIDEHIKEIINEFEYNVENYNKLILKNEELNNIIYDLRDENEKLKNDNDKLQKKVDDFQPELDIKKKTISDSLQGSLLFAFECTESNLKKYKCEMIKEKGLDEKIEMYKKIYPDGKLVFTKKIKTINVYKIIQYMLKKHLIYVGEDTYTGDIDAIKLIYNIVAKIEEKFILNESLEDTLELLENNTIDQNVVETDPEQPQIRKAKREIEQIDKNTGRVIARYESLNAAARALNCTGNAVGIALRNSTLCKGFVWKYVGVTLDQQLTSQKVIKICCEDGTITKFNSYVEAGKDGGVSSVTIRNRILTNVHSRLNGKNYHWIIDTEK